MFGITKSPFGSSYLILDFGPFESLIEKHCLEILRIQYELNKTGPNGILIIL